MASTHSLTFFAREATEAGALAGHGFRCSCGSVQTTSLGEREAKNSAYAHAEWHVRKVAA